jgi:hypothetical protein
LIGASEIEKVRAVENINVIGGERHNGQVLKENAMTEGGKGNTKEKHVQNKKKVTSVQRYYKR